MGSEAPSNPSSGRSACGAPEPTAFLERSGREEPDSFVRRGKKLAARVLAGGALPIGLFATHEGLDPLTTAEDKPPRTGGTRRSRSCNVKAGQVLLLAASAPSGLRQDRRDPFRLPDHSRWTPTSGGRDLPQRERRQRPCGSVAGGGLVGAKQALFQPWRCVSASGQGKDGVVALIFLTRIDVPELLATAVRLLLRSRTFTH